MKKLNYFIPVFFLTLLFQSCYYDEELPEDDKILPTNVSFSQDVQPIFNINCVSCHGGNQAPNLTSDQSFNELMEGNYVIPFNSENSELMKSLLGDNVAIMPPSGSLNQSDIDKISQWIDEGALDN